MAMVSGSVMTVDLSAQNAQRKKSGYLGVY
jgi:hypothetical protein